MFPVLPAPQEQKSRIIGQIILQFKKNKSLMNITIARGLSSAILYICIIQHNGAVMKWFLGSFGKKGKEDWMHVLDRKDKTKYNEDAQEAEGLRRKTSTP